MEVSFISLTHQALVGNFEHSGIKRQIFRIIKRSFNNILALGNNHMRNVQRCIFIHLRYVFLGKFSEFVSCGGNAKKITSLKI